MAGRHGLGSNVSDFSTPRGLKPPTPLAVEPEPGRIDCTFVDLDGKVLDKVLAAWPALIVVGDRVDVSENTLGVEIVERTWNRHGELTITLAA